MQQEPNVLDAYALHLSVSDLLVVHKKDLSGILH